ncbi:MAG: putative hydrolase [Bacteroidetes bacterium]|jgi:phosphoribosyl 1,2-cyclic phosphate phosphodiesterase|nr:putative hydrolase [Bacteroidota bacterium]
MKIVFLGTGTSTGIPQIGCKCAVCTSDDKRDKRLRSSVVVQTGSKTVLIDCGPDFRMQVLTNNIEALDAILITHGHYDHLGGLDDIRPFGDTKVYAESNVIQQIKSTMPYCFAEKRYPGVPLIDLIEIGEEDFYIDDLKVTPVRAMHARLPVLGFRIGNMAYLTDVKSIAPEEIEKLKSLDVLVVNALRIKEHIAHFSLSEALDFVTDTGAKQAYLTHFSHDLGKHADVEKLLPLNVHLAYDGLNVRI